MRKSQTFLAYYSVIMASSLAIWSFFMAPQPDGFVLAVFILPISIYFWILVSGKMPHNEQSQPHSSSEKNHLGLILTIALTISTASILLYISLAGLHSKTEMTDTQSDIKSTLGKIQSDISALKRNSDDLENISTRIKFIESSLLKLESKKIDIQPDVLGTLLTPTVLEPTTKPSITPVTNVEP